MHSHDRTLLAKLGFSDPDRKNERHDLACHYLSQIEVAAKIFRAVARFRDVPIKPNGDGRFFCLDVKKPSTLESHIQKGEGQYATTIGFIDVALNVQCWMATPEQSIQCHAGPESRIGVEVKIAKAAVGDVLRQIKLYRSYSRIDAWALVTDFSLTRTEMDALLSEQVYHFELGPNFDAWAERLDEAAYASPTL